ncbi:hypothetical protein TREMEDRAFT_32155 [Tremella mesenterica DSM 1558]|uniref:uncharacterized protein n=1 Tax=Tremella mesenterica (strain ATCC 24925 / CBS 8224 / DSM 1558 / NBRC 9311 / NRRL Y-6157 / RJB 2259-6 / UBC 559-6) TaxID=578456 RepID=UPI0003F48F86|nr:uncharacterized protein TREMEDRAFT_32155 [Tremella mesenterica DSM 1558]EIW68289.1 hypothetical protein TREMEDRAFT_32155 [Tremella mesenterica DSM 1558]
MLSTLLPLALYALPFAAAGYQLPDNWQDLALATSPDVYRNFSSTHLTARTSTTTTETCAKVAGTWGTVKYDFGCLCMSDVDDYAADNHIDNNIVSLIKYYIAYTGDTKSYPINAQPTCDGKGGFDCGEYQLSNGACVRPTVNTVVCPSGYCLSSGHCCPRGQTYSNGKCCGSSGCSHSGTTCSPAYCNGYTSNGVCCPSGTPSGGVGQSSICCPSGQVESNGQYGKTCVSKCSNGMKTYNSNTEKCEAKCIASDGYVYSVGYNGVGRCCKTGQTACQTVCCPVGQEEVGNTGHCCLPGSTYSNGQCHSPTMVPRRRNLNQKKEIQTTIFGLEENKAANLCPVGLAACPIPGRMNDYECLDAMNDLQSCGGCTSMGTGIDCTAIPGVRWMGCNVGKCEVYSCKAGFKKVGSNRCVRV